jgi:protein-S-isoprenylcysteine O-methyltransferase Ste14
MNNRSEADQPLDHRSGIIRWTIISIVFLILMAGSFFLSAGTTNWPAAWAYLIMAGLTYLLDALVLIRISPELLGERSRLQTDAKRWDQVLSRLMATIGPLIIWILCGLDYRYGWSPDLPTWMAVTAGVCVFGGGMLALWAMASNRLFIGMVRIQTERGHHVIQSGPYQYVRHPGYLGSVFFILFTPLMLGSLVALLPGFLTTGVVVIRTHLEDQTLRVELHCYQDYARQVTWKLLPGVW